MRTAWWLASSWGVLLVTFAMGACGGSGANPDGGLPDGGDGGPPPIPSPFGLDSRPPNPTCLAPPRPPSTINVRLTRVFQNVQLNQPIHVARAPGDPNHLYVLQRGGTVVRFPTSNPPNTPTTVLTVPRTVNTAGEGGLLGFAFHPSFAQNGHLYISYTTNGGNTGMQSVVARMTSTDGGASFAAGTYTDIIPPFPQPYTNHNGGDAHFGKDGYLYLSFGDGGSGGDPLNNGQTTSNKLGKILRIDVDKPQGGNAYGIPPDNPFASGGGDPTIYAWGLRNPFRFSIDAQTGQVWAGDVGQNLWEEVDKINLGGNYGWRYREGKHCYNPSTNCPTAGLIDPVWEYDRSMGNSITGGVVYRGSAIPSLVGRYIVGDFGSGRVWALEEQGDGSYKETEIGNGGGGGWVAFGEGPDGEVYAVSLTQGALYKLVPDAPEPPSTFPDKLSKTGCFEPQSPKIPTSGLIPYAPTATLWSDGADKLRWMALPDGKQITLAPNGHFEFPIGTVLVKSFALGGKLVETRLLVRHDDGGWAGYSYEWDDAQTDATLLPSNKSRVVGNQTWYYPSRAECNRCHTQAAGVTLGAELAQLNADFVYASTNRLSNQLRTLEHIGMFASPLPGAIETLPRLSAIGSQDPIEARARSYLHANCSFCHQPNGGGGGTLDLRWQTSFAATTACGTAPQNGDLGLMTSPKIIDPGKPANSILVQRPKRLDVSRMPPLATSLVDPEGTAVLEQWVQGLAGCPAPVDAGTD
jgi:uncharacterized repeat protein (TIGR03806 family)